MEDSQPHGGPTGTGIMANVSVVLGLSFLWPNLYSDAFSPFTLIREYYQSSRIVLCGYYLIFSVLLFALAFVCYGWGARIVRRPEAHRRIAIATVSILGTSGLALVALSANPDDIVTVPHIIGIVLVSFWLFAIFLAWGRRLISRPPLEIARVICISYLAYLVINMGTLVPGANQLRLVYLYVAPFLSTLLLIPGGDCRLPGWNKAVSFHDAFQCVTKGIVIPTILLILLGVIAIRPLLVPTSAAESILENQNFITTIASLVIMIAMTIWYFVKDWSSESELTLFAFLAVMMALGFVLMIAFNDYHLAIYKRFVIASEHCVEMFVLIALLVSGGRNRISPYFAPGFFLLVCFLVPRFIGNILIFFVDTDEGAEQNVPIAIFAAMAVFLIMVCTVFFLVRRSNELRQRNDREIESVQIERCEHLAESRGIPKREAEAMYHLYQRHSTKTIADEMGIADSTVKTYQKNIYSKLGIHRRDELIALIEDSDNGTR